MITVMGATGTLGGQVARRLLEAGEKVRALGRSRGKLAETQGRRGDGRRRGRRGLPDALPFAARTPSSRCCRPTCARPTTARSGPAGRGDRAGRARQRRPPRRLPEQRRRRPARRNRPHRRACTRRRSACARSRARTCWLLRPGSFFENFYASLPAGQGAGRHRRRGRARRRAADDRDARHRRAAAAGAARRATGRGSPCASCSARAT